MKALKSFSVVIFIVLMFLGLSSLYIVNEGQGAILLRFGEIILDKDTGKAEEKTPGLHFKLPFVNTARILDIRLQTLDIKSSRIVTEEKKDVLVDYYVKWRIKDLPLYFTRTGGRAIRAQTLLEQKLNDSLRAEFGKRNISEVVSGERSDIMSLLLKQAGESAKALGIEVIDVRIKRIDLPEEVSTAVFERMRAERERIANEHRAKGKAEATALRAKADADVTVIVAEADSQGKKIRSEGDAIAAQIYADAYSKDPEFYAFYRSLLAYENSFKEKDFVIIRPDIEFFKYFKQSKSSS